MVFLPGAGSFGLDFLLVHERVKQLLQTVGVLGPYLLVGHSLGGVYAQRYAQRFPDEVAGLLLLDPAHEDWDLYMPEHLQIARNQTPDSQMPDLPEGFLAQYRGPFADMFAAFPPLVRDLRVDKHLGPERLSTGFREGANVLDVFDELRAGGDRPDIPMIILSGTGIDPAQKMLAAEAQLREQIAGSEKLYEAIVAKSPRAEHRSLDDASHLTIPMARPDAVAAAISDVIDRAYGQ